MLAYILHTHCAITLKPYLVGTCQQQQQGASVRVPEALTFATCGVLHAVWVVMTDLRKWRFLRVEVVETAVYLLRPCQDMHVHPLPGTKVVSKEGMGTVSSSNTTNALGLFCRMYARVFGRSGPSTVRVATRCTGHTCRNAS